MRSVTITLGRNGGADCQVIDNETGKPIPEVRKVTIVSEVRQPTIATVEILPSRVEAQALATIDPPTVVDGILRELLPHHPAGMRDDEAIDTTPRELRAALAKWLPGFDR